MYFDKIRLNSKKVMMCIAVLSSFSVSAAPVDDIIADMPVGTWYEFPNSQMRAVAPDPLPVGNNGFGGILAWSGGAFDTKRNRLLVWGGGHLGYSGTEIYGFDMDANPPRGLRLTEPSSDISEAANGLYPDGTPRSQHSENHLEYVPGLDKFFVFGTTSGYPMGGDGARTVSALDMTSLKWNAPSTYPDVPSNGAITGSVSVYDPVTSTVWVKTGRNGTMFNFDPANKTWKTYSSSHTYSYSTAALDPERRLLVSVGCGYCGEIGGQMIRVWDLDNPSAAPFTPTTTGDDTIEKSGAVGFQYDPVLKGFVAWVDGTDVYFLDPDNWQWTKISVASSNKVTPTPHVDTGTYGRFRYVPSKNVYILMNKVGDNVFMLKLTDGSGTVEWPTVNIAADPATVTEGESTDLKWTTSNADSCTASSDWNGGTLKWEGAKAVSTGSEVVTETVGPVNTASTFTLNCTGSSRSAVSSIVVNVTASSGTVPPAKEDPPTKEDPPAKEDPATKTPVTGGGTAALASDTGGAGAINLSALLLLLLVTLFAGIRSRIN